MAECHILLKDEIFHLRSIKLGRKFFPKRLDIFGIYGATTNVSLPTPLEDMQLPIITPGGNFIVHLRQSL